MTVLAQVWSETGRTALGLAPSAAAAAVLREATGMPTETLAKLDQLAAGDATGLAAHIGPRTLVVIDEAGMTDTPTLDRVVAFCIEPRRHRPARRRRPATGGDRRRRGAPRPRHGVRRRPLGPAWSGSPIRPRQP